MKEISYLFLIILLVGVQGAPKVGQEGNLNTQFWAAFHSGFDSFTIDNTYHKKSKIKKGISLT